MDTQIRDALATANSALSEIRGHEQVCTVRYKSIDIRLDAMASQQADQHFANEKNLMEIRNAMWACAIGLIALLLTAVGTLVVHELYK